MKKTLTLLPAILLTTWLGCGGNPETTEPASNAGVNGENSQKTKGIIAYTPLTLSNPFFKVIGDHIKAEAEKNGYETLIVDPDMDVKKQSAQIDDFIAKNVTAIVLVPCDRLSVGPAVQAANKAGIPVFTVDAKCASQGAKIEGHVGTDNFQGGELAGKAMIDALGEKGGKVLILDFKKANSCVLRVAGFKKVIDAHNKDSEGKFESVCELDGNGERTKGYQSTADALQAHENLDAIFAINDPSALGAYTAVKEAKRENKIKIIKKNNLTTICEEAACPNISECWQKKHATFMILGDTCTRACAFCNVITGKPKQLDPLEPIKISSAVKKLNLKHAVITSCLLYTSPSPRDRG